MDFEIINNFLSPEKCQELITLSEAQGYKEADISYPSGAKMNKDYRNNSRCLYSDELLRIELENLIIPFIGVCGVSTVPFIKEGGGIEHKEFLRLSGNFRFYKYQPGEEFKRHRDTNTLEECGVSLVTILIYLNDVEDGGETNLCDKLLGDKRQLVKPEAGKLLMFDHSVIHSGEVLKSGVKYILRTDLIYKL